MDIYTGTSTEATIIDPDACPFALSAESIVNVELISAQKYFPTKLIKYSIKLLFTTLWIFRFPLCAFDKLAIE